MINIKKLAITGAMAATMFGMTAVSAFAATTVVTPADMEGWAFAQETPTGSGSIVSGPLTPPLGTGSTNLIVDGTGGEILYKVAYQGLKLSDINTLGYSTYRTSGGSALAIALQFNFDGNVTDADDSWQGRLVYEPYHTQTVNTGVWQTWDPLDDTAGIATGNWWFSNGTHAANSGCTMANPCTWAEVNSAFPSGGVHNTLGAVILKAGGGWTGGFNGNVDALTVNSDTYNFEPTLTPLLKDECKDGGWMDFNTPTFKNQGECVSYVQANPNAGKQN